MCALFVLVLMCVVDAQNYQSPLDDEDEYIFFAQAVEGQQHSTQHTNKHASTSTEHRQRDNTKGKRDT